MLKPDFQNKRKQKSEANIIDVKDQTNSVYGSASMKTIPS